MKFRVIRPLYSIISLSFFMVMFLAAILMLFFEETLIIGIVTVVLFLIVSYSMIDSFLVRSIVINEYGVEYISIKRKFVMKWDEIKIIGLGYVPIKGPSKKPWIYFAADGISMPMLNAKMVNDKFFMVTYSKKIEDAIRMYWTGNIDGLDSMSEFEMLYKTKKKLT